MVQAARKSAAIVRATTQILDQSSASTVMEILSDVIANAKMISNVGIDDDLVALPAITRPDLESDAKILLVGTGEEPFQGYSAFLALTDRARRENADFFMQPHRTEVVWGGQKTLYIFQHHSGEFGLYYELGGKEIFPGGPAGLQMPTCTIVVKNQVYIPIPDPIVSGFSVDPGGHKSFEVRCDLLFPDSHPGKAEN